MAKKSLFAIGLIALNLVFPSCASAPEIKPAPDGNSRVADCYFYNGHTYIFVTKARYWHPARQRCEETGGRLVVLQDTDEFEAMRKICVGSAWIGLTDEEVEGSYVWVDGTRLKYGHWASNEPNNGIDCVFYPENYICLWDRADHLWNDAATVALIGSICEYEFLIEDPVRLVRLRDYLNEKTDAKIVVQETLKTKLVKTLEEKVKELPKGRVNIQPTATGVRISVADLNFNPDSTELLEAERLTLAALAKLLAPFRDRTVLFIGHTAQWGSVESCLALSRDRARVIARAFIANGTLRPEKVKTDGRGFLEPLADNATEEGMRKNRRVEIIVLD